MDAYLVAGFDNKYRAFATWENAQKAITESGIDHDLSKILLKTIHTCTVHENFQEELFMRLMKEERVLLDDSEVIWFSIKENG